MLQVIKLVVVLLGLLYRSSDRQGKETAAQQRRQEELRLKALQIESDREQQEKHQEAQRWATCSWPKILGISNSPTQDEIYHAFQNLVLQRHPDFGGDPLIWDQIVSAKALADNWLKFGGVV